MVSKFIVLFSWALTYAPAMACQNTGFTIVDTIVDESTIPGPDLLYWGNISVIATNN